MEQQGIKRMGTPAAACACRSMRACLCPARTWFLRKSMSRECSCWRSCPAATARLCMLCRTSAGRLVAAGQRPGRSGGALAGPICSPKKLLQQR